MVAISGFAIGWPDGFANAPTGSPQFPTLLSGYVSRAPWHVPGVDYAVGYNSGTVLKDPFQGLSPSNINLDPSLVSLGGSYDSGNIIINFSGVNNIDINGWDFSLNGGQRVAVNANGVTFQNNNCKVGTNSQILFVTESGTTPNGLTIQYNVFDGNKQKTTAGSDSAGGLVRLGSKGSTLFQYNFIKNAWYQEVTCGPTPSISPFNMTFQYNVFQNSGYGASSGDHGDILQAFSSSVGSPTFNDVEFNWNLILQNELAANAATQGVSTGGSAGNTAIYLNENMSNNTVVVPAAGNINYPFIINSDEVNGNSNLSNNFVDLTGCHLNAGSAVGAYFSDSGTGGGPFHGTVSTANNVNMVNGAVL